MCLIPILLNEQKQMAIIIVSVIKHIKRKRFRSYLSCYFSQNENKFIF